MIKYFGIKPIVVSAGIKTGLKIKTENPKQVGADCIVDAVAGYTLHGGPVIVIGIMELNTTYDVVGADGTFEAELSLRESAPLHRQCGIRQQCSRQSRLRNQNQF